MAIVRAIARARAKAPAMARARAIAMAMATTRAQAITIARARAIAMALAMAVARAIASAIHWDQFGSISNPFGCLLAVFWMPFGCFLDAFWNLGRPWGPFWRICEVSLFLGRQQSFVGSLILMLFWCQ